MLFCSLKIHSQEGWTNLNFMWKLSLCASVTIFPLYKRKSCWRDLQISPMPVGPGLAPGGPSGKAVVPRLINGRAMCISRREPWCYSYSTFPEIWHWVKFAFLSQYKASELKNKIKQNVNLILAKWTERRVWRHSSTPLHCDVGQITQSFWASLSTSVTIEGNMMPTLQGYLSIRDKLCKRVALSRHFTNTSYYGSKA